MTPATDAAVSRVVIRPLPHHLCKACNPARRKPLAGKCPGCGKEQG